MHAPTILCPRRLFLSTRRTFFSPPAPQPSNSAPSSSFDRPPAYEDTKTVQIQAHVVKVKETTRVEVDVPSHVGNPDYGGKYGQQEAERYELVKE
ncbi:hypothetical protein JCM10296v2_002475 [Rhodotorula toruloides]